MTWLDGYGGDTALGGSTAGYIDAPFVETSVVHGGRQSLPLIFDNDGGFVDIDGNAGSPRFSEVRREFDANVDLTEGGAQVLAVSFRGTPAAEDVAIAQRKVEQAQNVLWAAQAQRDAVCGRLDKSTTQADCDSAQAQVQKTEAELRIVEIQLEQLLQGTAVEDVAVSEAQLQQEQAQLGTAQTQVQQAEANLARVLAGAGADEIASAEARVALAEEQLARLTNEQSALSIEAADLVIEQARVNLELAETKLSRTALLAPFGGVVVDVRIAVGTQGGAAPAITLADLPNPQIRFYVEETDLQLVSLDTKVMVIFRALPDTIFEGRVASISPSLSVVDSIAAAKVTALLEEHEQLAELRAGMEADVEVIAAAVEDVLLVPIEALRELAPDTYGVFVVDETTQELKLRPVEVGIKDFAWVEIRSGLSKGELVSTGTVETN